MKGQKSKSAKTREEIEKYMEYQRKYRQSEKGKAKRQAYAKEYNKRYYLKHREEILTKSAEKNEQNKKPRTCLICGKTFMPSGNGQKYCPKCKETAYKLKGLEYRNREEIKQHIQEYGKTYRQSEHGKEVRKVYESSDKVKEYRRTYYQSDKGKEVLRKYYIKKKSNHEI